LKEDFSYEYVHEFFSQFLERKNMRKTSERFAVLEYVNNYKGHFDAEMLFTDMQQNYRVSLATIYNTIELLILCGLVVKHPFGGQTARYEKTFGKQSHQHLVCLKCGSVKEFSDKKLKATLKHKTFPKFESTNYSLYVYGICGKCSAAK
jgi:Fur family transcriptional regulator, ferric uptake regulator